ncbi:tRNA (guanine(9)-N(1))-methyltransferase [Xylographa trunciseda]|nr:tRNA (guanine(9)-N(1))-methyltransferase [Xylographa trunciseda]
MADMEAEERPSKMRKLSGGFDGAIHAGEAGSDNGGTAINLNQVSKIDAMGVQDMNTQIIDDELLSSKLVESTSASISDMQTRRLSNETKITLESTDENTSQKIADEVMDDENIKDEVDDFVRAVFSGIQPDDPLVCPPLSKNQMKKLKRKQEWEAGREYRKVKRKEKIQEKKQRKRAAPKDEDSASTTALPTSTPTARNNKPAISAQEALKRSSVRSVQLPITVIFDCGFDDLMLDKERISLAAQLTRCYSDNHHAPFQFHMAVSSFDGKLKERFDTVLSGHHQSWKGVRFLADDFVEAAEQAKEWMVGPQGGVLAGAFTGKASSDAEGERVVDTGEMETVYLTSDSPDTLTELKPYSTYIIGGIVDRNRHKGICYKRAMDREMKTARLPIGQYMDMASRFVLATNHVSEIMVKWLDLGDWGEAFLKVVPKRKGGVLKGAGAVKEEVDAKEDEAGDVVPGIESKQEG